VLWDAGSSRGEGASIMPTVTTLGVFTAAALVLCVVPGPAVLYVISRSVDEGRVAGVVSVLGVAAGSMVHVLAAVTGLSAVLASSSTAFVIVKYLGAAYLVWLGLQVLRSRDRAGPPEPNRRFILRDQAVAAGAEATPDSRRAESDRPAPLARAFRQGAIVQALNPKLRWRCSSWPSCLSSSTQRSARQRHKSPFWVRFSSCWRCSPTGCTRFWPARWVTACAAAPRRAAVDCDASPALSISALARPPRCRAADPVSK
jgi:threonine/homoserine/homoserine lactone efflux protein